MPSVHTTSTDKEDKMSQQKEKRSTERPNREPSFGGNFEYGNRLVLPEALKASLTEQGLDWRFLNTQEFRASGNYHRSQWVPYKVKAEDIATYGATAEGMIQRGDLILGVRSKATSAKHREFLAERNRRYSNFNKTEAQKLRQHVKDNDLGGHVKVVEGDDED
jgi:hypothetical protein